MNRSGRYYGKATMMRFEYIGIAFCLNLPTLPTSKKVGNRWLYRASARACLLAYLFCRFPHARARAHAYMCVSKTGRQGRQVGKPNTGAAFRLAYLLAYLGECEK